ncbi:uncharacterized protein LOC110115703 [Dendrobium catenatum]|uniref:uncharacterized protein LOC110115703 n=1 Tax=Dendrobium catenatum TaxID=906689 RepID=UPI0009F19F9E|nr:uncharacterized protein LOC110115703 [Dendrobium catenatum]
MVSTKYGPWIHVQFKNKRARRNITNSNSVKDIGSKPDYIVFENMQVTQTEEIQLQAKTDCNVDKIGGVLGILKMRFVFIQQIVLLFWWRRRKEKLWVTLGTRKKEASLYLKEMVRDEDVFFIGLMETKLSSIDRREVDCLMGNEWDYFHQPAIGTSGGILVIISNLSVPSLGMWKIATVYGSRCYKERSCLWNQLEKSMENSTPSIIGGDFNCNLNKDEKRGGKRFLFSEGPREMKSFMGNSYFHDIGSVGPRFTWCNNKESTSRIWERLDRCILNSVAMQKLPFVVNRHLARMASDHCPIVIKMDEMVRLKSRTIRFEDTWRSYLAAKSIVYHSWKKNDVGDEYTILQKKLNQKLKKEILDLHNKEALNCNWSADDIFELRSKIHELNVTLRRLSTWWNQRAKARWHEEGDANSKLFHSFATARRNGNRIFQIKDEANKLQEEQDQIENVFINFFEKKWKYRECELTG